MSVISTMLAALLLAKRPFIQYPKCGCILHRYSRLITSEFKSANIRLSAVDLPLPHGDDCCGFRFASPRPPPQYVRIFLVCNRAMMRGIKPSYLHRALSAPEAAHWIMLQSTYLCALCESERTIDQFGIENVISAIPGGGGGGAPRA